VDDPGAEAAGGGRDRGIVGADEDGVDAPGVACRPDAAAEQRHAAQAEQVLARHAAGAAARRNDSDGLQGVSGPAT
jgi:hypothetical protein